MVEGLLTDTQYVSFLSHTLSVQHNPLNSELLNFQSPEVVSRYRDPQLQVNETF